MATSETGLAQLIERLIEPTVDDLGFAIVRVRLTGQKEKRLQIMIERKDLTPMDVDDCAAVSRAVSAALDVSDPINGPYDLEVSSPGIDRPLTRPQDFERFAGFEARVETARPIDGRKRFRGRLLGLEDGCVRMNVDNTEWRVPFEDIGRAKLVITDDLLAQAGEQ